MRNELEKLLFDMRFDMDCIGCEAEMWEELETMSTAELSAAIMDYLEDLE